jgi:uncharacterized protein YdbL (DUF1318 family)
MFYHVNISSLGEQKKIISDRHTGIKKDYQKIADSTNSRCTFAATLITMKRVRGTQSLFLS